MNSISQIGYRGLQVPEWWRAVPAEEQQVLRNFMRSMGGMKHSRRPRVAWAAAKWERRLRCFIKVRLISDAKRTERRKRTGTRRGEGQGVKGMVA